MEHYETLTADLILYVTPAFPYIQFINQHMQFMMNINP